MGFTGLGENKIKLQAITEELIPRRSWGFRVYTLDPRGTLPEHQTSQHQLALHLLAVTQSRDLQDTLEPKRAPCV